MMNSPEVLFWLQLISAVGSFLSGAGIVLAGIGLFFLIRQTRASERATTATVYQSIVALGDSINDMFMKDPDLHGEIFSTAVFASVEQEQFEHPRRFYAALRWLNYFETILVSWSAIPGHLQEPWAAYIRDHLAKSPYMTRVVLDTSWYGDDLVRLCREAQNP